MAQDGHRPIRSFVLRQGRISVAQQRAFETLWSQWGIDFSTQTALLQQLPDFFDGSHPLVLEIGFGMGETTATIAQRLPDTNFLAVDVHRPGVGSLLKRIAETGVKNIRVLRHDAVEVVDALLLPGTLDGVHLFFPDPWPKKRHHKRRLVQPAFVELLASRLKPGGYLHMATDWEDYARHMLQVLQAESTLRNCSEAFSARPEYRPLTKFEQRGLRLGHGVWDLIFRKPL